MNKKWNRYVFGVATLIFAIGAICSFQYVLADEEIVVVNPKGGTVHKNDEIESNKLQDVTAKSCETTVGGEYVVTTSKILEPQNKETMAFLLFSGDYWLWDGDMWGLLPTHVDIKHNTGDLPSERLKDTCSQIQVQTTSETVTAANFRLRAEGNIFIPGDGGDSAHWSIKTEEVDSVIVLEVNGIDVLGGAYGTDNYVLKNAAGTKTATLTVRILPLPDRECEITLTDSAGGGTVDFLNILSGDKIKLGKVGNQVVDFKIVDLAGTTKGDTSIVATCTDLDTVTEDCTVVDLQKIKLGDSGTIATPKYTIGVIYVPTKWGGKLTVTPASGRNAKIFYDDGVWEDSEFVISLMSDDMSGAANPKEKEVAKDKYKWCYVRITGTASVAVSNTFVQEKTVSKTPWSCPWYPISEEWQLPHLYDTGGPLDKYKQAYGTDPLAIEKAIMAPFNFKFTPAGQRVEVAPGGYLAKKTIKDVDAERTVGYDYNNSGAIQPNIFLDFDGDSQNDEYKAWWWGHCHLSAAVIICENEPTGNGAFTMADAKGLLVALYKKNYTNKWEVTHDPVPHKWHQRLEEEILGNDSMFVVDAYNSNYNNDDIIWNYPVYAIQEAKYKQKAEQDDETVVEITAEVKCTSSENGTLYYKYCVTYDGSGVASSSEQTDWQNHPSAPANYKRPGLMWKPNLVTSGVSAYWQGTLDYTKIRAIAPAP